MDDFADKMEKTHIVLLHETWEQSAASDLITLATFVALWSLGYFADSAALEWIGVLLGLVFLWLRVMRFLKRSTANRMTPDQARAWLDRRFPQAPDTP